MEKIKKQCQKVAYNIKGALAKDRNEFPGYNRTNYFKKEKRTDTLYDTKNFRSERRLAADARKASREFMEFANNLGYEGFDVVSLHQGRMNYFTYVDIVDYPYAVLELNLEKGSELENKLKSMNGIEVTKNEEKDLEVIGYHTPSNYDVVIQFAPEYKMQGGVDLTDLLEPKEAYQQPSLLGETLDNI